MTTAVGDGPASGSRRAEAGLEARIDARTRGRIGVRRLGDMIFLEARLPGPFRTIFTTRLGGESQTPFASLNLDVRSDDDALVVDRNRTRVAGAIAHMEAARSGTSCAPAAPAATVGSAATASTPSTAVPASTALSAVPASTFRAGYRLVSPAQIHGLRVVGAAEYVHDHEGSPCDGLTLHPLIDRGLAAVLLFADCVPVVLVGEVDMAVAHAGWRGVLGGMVQQAARAMTGPPGLAVIGPSIGPCCFTVGPEVAEAFARRFGPAVVVGEALPAERSSISGALRREPQQSTGRSQRVDLWAATTRALGEIGVKEEHVVNPRLCTVCNVDLFYSYRVEGPSTGRHGCVAWTAAG